MADARPPRMVVTSSREARHLVSSSPRQLITASARHRVSSSPRRSSPRSSHIEPEVHDVPVLHHVLAPLQPVLPGFLGRGLAAECCKVVVSDDLRADEALL